MPKSSPNQTSFSRGELSPLVSGRTDSEVYNEGLATLRNMYSDSRGPAKNRESLKHVIQVAQAADAKIETFERGGELITFVFSDLELILVRNVDNPIIETFVSPWSESQVKDVYIVPLPDGRVFYFFHPNVEPHKLIDTLGSVVTVEFLADGNFTVPTGIISLSVCVCGGGGGGGGGGSVIAGQSSGGGGGGGSGVVKNAGILVTPAEVIPITVGASGFVGVGSGSGGPTSGGNGGDSAFTATSTVIASIGGGGGGRGFGPGGNNDGIAGIGNSGGGNGGSSPYGSGLKGQNGQACSAICGGSSFPGGIAGQITFSSGSTGGGGGGGGFGAGGGGGDFTLGADRGLPGVFGGGGGGGRQGRNGGAGGPGKVTITYVSGGAGLSLDPVVFTAAPVGWTNLNWPSCGVYHQSRLYMAGEPELRERIIASVVGEPEDLTIGVTDDDAFNFIMESYGGIEWLVSTKELLLGTVNGEYVVTSNAGVITPTDIQILQQSAYGSASIQPIKIGDQVVYVTPDRRKVRAMNYEERKQNWMSVDLTFESEHITKGLIRDISWAQHPNNLLWVTLDDGTMACLSYERGNDISGWHRHDTDGKILGMSAGFNGEKDVAVAIVIRNAGFIELESMADDHYQDSWAETSTFTAYTAPIEDVDMFYIEGFGHLEGKGVQVTVDAAVHPDRIVGAESLPGEGDGVAGRVYLQYDGNIAVVGLGYFMEMEMLDMDGGSNTGSGKHQMKRWNKVYVQILNSGLPLINGKRGNDRSSSSLMDGAEPLITDYVRATLIGWDRGARIKVSQDLPLPLTVLSVYGELKKNSL